MCFKSREILQIEKLHEGESKAPKRAMQTTNDDQMENNEGTNHQVKQTHEHLHNCNKLNACKNDGYTLHGEREEPERKNY